jgi:hypothetical protein
MYFAQIVCKLLACLVEEKDKYSLKFLLDSLTTHSNSKDFSDSRIKLFRLSFSFIVSIFPGEQ